MHAIFKLMSAEGMPLPEQDGEGTTLPRGYELFRAVRNGLVLVSQPPPIESSPEQDQQDSDMLDELYGQACECGYSGCNCRALGY